MAARMLDASITPAARFLDQLERALLAGQTDELAGLRFSILLTSKWEASDTVPGERRAELRQELSILRSLYLNQLDEIAMSFGVQKAIELKEEIERTVSIPEDMCPSAMPTEWEELYF
jgi:hypothetical protein